MIKRVRSWFQHIKLDTTLVWFVLWHMALLSGRSSPIQKPQWYLAAAKNMANHTASNKWAVEPHTWNTIFLGYNLVHIIIHTTFRQYCSWLRAEHWLTNELNIIPISYADNKWAPDAWSFLVAKKRQPLIPCASWMNRADYGSTLSLQSGHNVLSVVAY